jgi:hypothetical protein
MRLIFVAAFIGVLAAPSPIVSAQSSGQSVMEVYKSPTCGCCSKWVEHMQQHGFTARVTDLDDRALDAVKAKYGVPRTAQSCHTALVGGFAIEGHVPAAEVKRLLKEKPTVTGIAVAGMPLGSPGMEVPGRAQAYNVIAFDKKGDSRVFASYR